MTAPFWNTSLSAVSQNKILIRGYRVQDLMERCSFGDVIYLTFKGELPAGNEGRMIEMIAVSSTWPVAIDCARCVAVDGKCSSLVSNGATVHAFQSPVSRMYLNCSCETA